MNNQINAEPLQQKKQDEIRIPANEKKNITQLCKEFGIGNWESRNLELGIKN